jgi:hypothetical protein
VGLKYFTNTPWMKPIQILETCIGMVKAQITEQHQTPAEAMDFVGTTCAAAAYVLRRFPNARTYKTPIADFALKDMLRAGGITTDDLGVALPIVQQLIDQSLTSGALSTEWTVSMYAQDQIPRAIYDRVSNVTAMPDSIEEELTAIEEIATAISATTLMTRLPRWGTHIRAAAADAARDVEQRRRVLTLLTLLLKGVKAAGTCAKLAYIDGLLSTRELDRYWRTKRLMTEEEWEAGVARRQEYDVYSLSDQFAFIWEGATTNQDTPLSATIVSRGAYRDILRALETGTLKGVPAVFAKLEPHGLGMRVTTHPIRSSAASLTPDLDRAGITYDIAPVMSDRFETKCVPMIVKTLIAKRQECLTELQKDGPMVRTLAYVTAKLAASLSELKRMMAAQRITISPVAGANAAQAPLVIENDTAFSVATGLTKSIIPARFFQFNAEQHWATDLRAPSAYADVFIRAVGVRLKDGWASESPSVPLRQNALLQQHPLLKELFRRYLQKTMSGAVPRAASSTTEKVRYGRKLAVLLSASGFASRSALATWILTKLQGVSGEAHRDATLLWLSNFGAVFDTTKVAEKDIPILSKRAREGQTVELVDGTTVPATDLIMRPSGTSVCYGYSWADFWKEALPATGAKSPSGEALDVVLLADGRNGDDRRYHLAMWASLPFYGPHAENGIAYYDVTVLGATFTAVAWSGVTSVAWAEVYDWVLTEHPCPWMARVSFPCGASASSKLLLVGTEGPLQHQWPGPTVLSLESVLLKQERPPQEISNDNLGAPVSFPQADMEHAALPLPEIPQDVTVEGKQLLVTQELWEL